MADFLVGIVVALLAGMFIHPIVGGILFIIYLFQSCAGVDHHNDSDIGGTRE